MLGFGRWFPTDYHLQEQSAGRNTPPVRFFDRIEANPLTSFEEPPGGPPCTHEPDAGSWAKDPWLLRKAKAIRSLGAECEASLRRFQLFFGDRFDLPLDLPDRKEVEDQ